MVPNSDSYVDSLFKEKKCLHYVSWTHLVDLFLPVPRCNSDSFWEFHKVHDEVCGLFEIVVNRWQLSGTCLWHRALLTFFIGLFIGNNGMLMPFNKKYVFPIYLKHKIIINPNFLRQTDQSQARLVRVPVQDTPPASRSRHHRPHALRPSWARTRRPSRWCIPSRSKQTRSYPRRRWCRSHSGAWRRGNSSIFSHDRS